ncbi:unnamed protein product [Cuscuta epithymum]|nr:unnamed protein product [Cuscuta epithymum]
MQCKSLEASEVGDPKSSWKAAASGGGEGGRSGCSRSISNLKDVVIHGSRRHLEKAGSCSPRSIGSSDFLTHQLVLHNSSTSSRCELRITRFASGGGGGSLVGTLRPGTPGPAPTAGGNHHHHHHHHRASSAHHYLNSSSLTRNRTTPSRGRRASSSSSSFSHLGEKSQGLGLSSKLRAASLSLDRDVSINNGSSSSVTCHKCGKQFSKWEALELHHLSHHAVTELLEGDSSRKIVEIICRSSWLEKSSGSRNGIERVLKVHNTQKTVARFEEYREMVKARAGKLAKRHPRCLADGNELLRFYGTTVACSLGDSGGPCTLCTSDKCHVCQVIRNGGLSIKDSGVGGGVFTTSTSARALESIQLSAAAAADGGGGEEEDSNPPPLYQRKAALIVCRVIAGRVHRPLENIQEMAGQTGFDSLAGKVGLHSNIEELYLLNPRALLPCFVVICKSYSPFSLY